MKYHWQPSSCDDCRDFTCKKDYDECAQNTHTCDQNADCINTVGSYTCQCRSGYTGDGHICTDYDECAQNTHTCDQNADCVNTVGSYTCQCRSGYTGDGHICT
ncbi:uromodulin-like, partial, partial [Paramuricea clavata]